MGTCLLNGMQVSLTPTSFRLGSMLAKHRCRLLSRASSLYNVLVLASPRSRSTRKLSPDSTLCVLRRLRTLLMPRATLAMLSLHPWVCPQTLPNRVVVHRPEKKWRNLLMHS